MRATERQRATLNGERDEEETRDCTAYTGEIRYHHNEMILTSKF